MVRTSTSRHFSQFCGLQSTVFTRCRTTPSCLHSTTIFVVLALLPRLASVRDNGDAVAPLLLALLVLDAQPSVGSSPLHVVLLFESSSSSECCLNSCRTLLRRPRMENWRKNDRCFPVAGGDGDAALLSLVSTRAEESDDSAAAKSTCRETGSLQDWDCREWRVLPLWRGDLDGLAVGVVNVAPVIVWRLGVAWVRIKLNKVKYQIRQQIVNEYFLQIVTTTGTNTQTRSNLYVYATCKTTMCAHASMIPKTGLTP